MTSPVELLASFTCVLLVQLVDVRVELNALTDRRANTVYLSRCVLTMALGKKSPRVQRSFHDLITYEPHQSKNACFFNCENHCTHWFCFEVLFSTVAVL